MKSAMELKEALWGYPKEVLVDLLAKLYRADGTARKEIDFLMQGSAYLDERLAEVKGCVQELPHYSAGEIKALFVEYMKFEKNKKKRIEALYFFIESALTAYLDQKCDHRMIMFASSSYGKSSRKYCYEGS